MCEHAGIHEGRMTSTGAERRSGVTVPLFSLRTQGDWGIGQITAMPASARFFRDAGQTLLQILPAHELAGGETSPYGACSAFALDPIYIDVDAVPDLDAEAIAAALGDVGRAQLEDVRRAASVRYADVRALKHRALRSAFDRFRERELAAGTERASAFRAFVAAEQSWLRDAALYCALRSSHDGWGWRTWPAPERDRAPEVLAIAHDPVDDGGLGTRVLHFMYLQWIALGQWADARAGIAEAGCELMGDLPFIVGEESADVWAHREAFRTDIELGAPPDAFSPDGQRWGLPVYDWDVMDRDGLAWLCARASHAARLYDRSRIDHVVGFFRQWVRKGDAPGSFVPETEAEQRARGRKVLAAMMQAAGRTPSGESRLIAEDLGVIPPFVRETMRELGLPGYKVLPWEKDDDSRSRDPRAFAPLSVATWSTHDTAPITSWWDELEPWEREQLGKLAGLGDGVTGRERDLALLGLLFASGSSLTLVLAQELLGDGARINTPGTVSDVNWTWRLPRSLEELASDADVRSRFGAVRELATRSGRLRV